MSTDELGGLDCPAGAVDEGGGGAEVEVGGGAATDDVDCVEFAGVVDAVGRSLVEYSRPGTEFNFASRIASNTSMSFIFRETFVIFSSQHSEKLFKNFTVLTMKLLTKKIVSWTGTGFT
jgi:hypothetical protein